jgi:DNA-binding IclR family transcriptional regulator
MPRMRTPDQIEGVKSPVQSLDRVFDILDVLAKSGEELSVNCVAGAVGFHITTTHRMLTAAMARGYVRQNPETGKYGLGVRLLRLAGGVEHSRQLRRSARLPLIQLARACGDTVGLAVLEEGRALVVDMVNGGRLPPEYPCIGRRLHVHSTAVGKAQSAYLRDDELEEIVAKRGLERLTDRTITTLAELVEELARVRQAGYALNQAENSEGVCGVAAPVFGVSGRVVGAIGLRLPFERVKSASVEDLGERVRQTAADVSARLERQ